MPPKPGLNTYRTTGNLRGDLTTCLGIGFLGAILARHALGLGLSPATVSEGLWVLVASPALEEYVFRVLLQQGLARWINSHAANAWTAVAFALAHAPLAGWMSIWWCLPSLVLGELWRRQQRWWPCAVAHAGFNLSLVGLTLISR